MQTKIIEKYFFFSLLLITLVFSFLIFKPFLTVLAVGACFAIVLYPLFRWFQKRKFPNWLSAFIALLFFLILLCGPLFGIGFLVFKQSQSLYFSIVEGGNARAMIEMFNTNINNFLPFDINIVDKISDLASVVSSNLSKVFSSTIYTIFAIFLTFISIFYFLKDGDRWEKLIINLSPLSEKDNKKIVKKLVNTINGVVKGYLLIAIIQGTLMGIGISIFGIENSILWGVVASIGALIPTLGTGIVAIPIIIYLLATGDTPQAIGFTLWAVIIVGTIDNFLSPTMIGSRINIHPLLILFSILGAIALMGPVGILIGPITLSFLYALVSIYREEYQENKINKDAE